MTIRRLAATGRAAATPGAPLGSGAAPSSLLRSSDSASPEPSGPWSTGPLARSGLSPMCPDRSVTHVPGCTVRPVFADLPSADVELWIAAKVEGLGWQAAGEAAGMDRAAIRRSRQRILRFLSTGDVLRHLLHRLDDVP